MNNRMLRIILFALVFYTVIISIGFGSGDNMASPSSPMTVNLSISKMPLINDTIDLYCRVAAYSDAPNTTAEITLPEGVELVSGHLIGQWDLKADVPVYLNATIKFSEIGDFKIQAIARHVIDKKTFWGDIANIFLTVGEKNSFYTPPPIWAYYPVEQISPGQAQRVGNISEIIPIDPKTLPSANKLPIASKDLSTINGIQSREFAQKSLNENTTGPTNPGTLTVTGSWFYWGQDTNYKTSPNTWLPAKSFLVGIVKASDNTFLGMGYTDGNGAYSIPITTNPGSDGFKVSLWTYNQYPNGEEMRVIMDTAYTGLTGLTGVYGWSTGKYTSADGTYYVGRINLPTTDTKYRACWLLNDLNRANRYFSAYSGGLASQGTIAWWPTDTFVGGWYSAGGQIHIASGLEVSSHVVIHEYGHNIMYTRYGNYWPPTNCNNHVWTECYNEGCGWVEGLADFFCCVPDNDPIYKDPRFSPIDFESATPGNGWCNGPRCEARVCGSLWDIFDSANDGYDTYGWGFGPIANVMISARQNTFADFWSQWQSKGYSTDASYCLLQNTIDPGINMPTVTNDGAASGIGATVATVGAQITNTGGQNPHLYIGLGTVNAGTGSWQHTADLGTKGTGTYYADLSPLTPGTTYYYRAYAINSAGTGWASSTATFNTPITPPVSGWDSLGGYITSSPSVIVDNLGKKEVWVKGGDNSLLFNIDGTWHGAGGVLTSDPFAVKDYNGKIHVLVRGGSYDVWDFVYNPAVSTGHWKGLGGYVTSGPTGAMEPTYHNFLRVVAKGGDNALWQCDLNINTETTSWYTNGGILTSGPYVIFDPASRQHTLVRGSDNALWDCEGVLGSDTNYHWTWSGLGGGLMSGPTACIEPTLTNYVAVFVKGGDNALWLNSVYSATQPETGTWNRLGGVISSDPFAVADTSANKIHVFARGGDSTLWENIFSTSPWNPNGNRWQGIGGSILTYKPGVGIGSNTQAFVIGTDHALWRNTHTTFSAASSKAKSTQQNDEPIQMNYPAGGPNSGSGKS